MKKIVKMIVAFILLVNMVHADDSEAKRLCDAEIKKEQPSRSILKKECNIVAKSYEEKKEYGDASWYYLLAGEYTYNIETIKDKITNGFLSNIAYSAVLKGNLDEAKVLYKIFLINNSVPWADNAVQDDYAILFRLYPQQKKVLTHGLALWDTLYKPLKEVNMLYPKYKQAHKEKRYKVGIDYLRKVISILRESGLQSDIRIADRKYNLGVEYNYNKEYEKSIKCFSEVEKIYRLEKSKRSSLGFLYHWMGDNYDRLKDYDKSLKSYDSALVMQTLYSNNDKSIDFTREEIKRVKSKLSRKNSAKFSKINLFKKRDTKDKKSIKKMFDSCKMLEIFEQDKKAKKCYLSIYVLLKNNHNATTKSLMQVYNKLGTIENKLKNYKSALDIYYDALKYYKNVTPKNDEDIAEIYTSISAVYFNLKKYKDSLEYLGKSMNIYENNLLNSNINKIEKQKTFLEILETSLNEKHKNNLKKKDHKSLNRYLNLALTYSVGGKTYLCIDDYVNAEKLFEKSLLIRKKLLPFEDKKIEESYRNLIEVSRKLGNKKKIELYARKLKKLKIKKLSDKANMYDGMGSTNLIVGDYKTSMRYMQMAYAIRKENLTDNPLELVKSYDNLLRLYIKLGNYMESEIYATKSLKLRKEVLGEKHQDTAISYYHMALIKEVKQNFNEALNLYLKAMNSMEINRNTELGTVYSSVGNIYLKLGKNKEALLYLKKGLDFNRDNLTKKIADNNIQLLKPVNAIMGISQTYTILSRLSYKLSFFEDALLYQKKAFELTDLILADKNPTFGDIYNNFSAIYFELANYSLAHDYAKKSFAIFILNRDKNFQILSNTQKKFYLKKNTNQVALLLSTAHLSKETNSTKTKAKTINQETLNSWLNYKGSIFDSENAIATLYESTTDKKVKEKIDLLVSSKRRIAKLYQTLPKPKERDQWKKNIKDTEEKISTLTKDIASKAQNFKEQQGLKDINYKDISSNLKENELYIDYAKAGAYYYVFSLDSKENITFTQIDDNNTKKINTLVKTFREDVTSILNDSSMTDEKLKELTTQSKDKLSKLYKLMLSKPLDKQLKTKTSLILSPDGALRLLPFEALYNETEKQYLIEEKNIRYIPSGKELVRLYKYGQIQRTVKSKEAVIFSNPNFDSKKRNSTKKEEQAITPNTSREGIVKSLFKMRFSPLPGTKEEAHSIEETLTKTSTVQEYKQEEANEANLLNVKQPNILHIATHGFFINDNSIPNPMLKSGIALSGANASAIRGQSDGIVTALKLSGLKLKGTDLVVLSACQTGVVDINSTDSVSGLSKAFIQAGAKDIVMSLWSVNDQATKDLMNSFYKEIDKQPNYATALKEAKLKMIKEGLHPFFWAAFVLSGL